MSASRCISGAIADKLGWTNLILRQALPRGRVHLKNDIGPTSCTVGVQWSPPVRECFQRQCTTQVSSFGSACVETKELPLTQQWKSNTCVTRNRPCVCVCVCVCVCPVIVHHTLIHKHTHTHMHTSSNELLRELNCKFPLDKPQESCFLTRSLKVAVWECS